MSSCDCWFLVIKIPAAIPLIWRHSSTSVSSTNKSLYTSAHIHRPMVRTAKNQKISIILALSIAILAVVLVTGTVVINIVSSAAYGVNAQTKTNLVASIGSPHVGTHSPFRHFTSAVTHNHLRPFMNTTAVTHSHFRPFITTFGHSTTTASNATATSSSTRTPINHIIVIFQENNSFDHYFGTYPSATNPKGESHFTPASGTPKVNNLEWPNYLLKNNPNKYQPQRISPNQGKICSPLHEYTVEQKSYNGGKMDKFVENDGSTSLDPALTACEIGNNNNVVMDYYDGNTVTALWNYAQHFAMSDHFYQSTFGESTPQHMNLVSGNTHGAYCYDILTKKELPDCLVKKDKRTIPAVVEKTMISNVDPEYDICSEAKPAGSTGIPTYKIEMKGQNIGDLLNKKDISWGWFSAGFKLVTKGDCNKREKHGGLYDYFPDVEPFQYYKSTSNEQHLPPTSVAKIGDKTDLANHQYSLGEFWEAVNNGYMPAVSFIKAPTYQQGHPGLSDPLAEQTFLVKTINGIEQSKQWPHTAIILTWDDSGGFYDHVMPPIVSPSDDPKNDALYGPTTLCNPPPAAKITQNDKCGYGPRIPLLIISPYAKENFVEYTKPTDFTSILRFIEDNWDLGQIDSGSLDAYTNSLDSIFDFKSPPHTTPLILDPTTGEIKK